MAFIYTLTALLSALLLFSVQPLVAKLILPVFGGTPAVWNTAMVFFQACLLLGYAYAHYSLKFLGWRIQGVLHIALLASAILLLPVALPDNWAPGTDGHSMALLTLLATIIGMPFFLVSASAPLLQRWFSLSTHPAKDNPYFLYAASNAGSMVALASYPLFWEPGFALNAQNQFWAWGFMGLTAAFLLCYGLLASKRDTASPQTTTATGTAPSSRQKLRWIGLAALPSALLLAVTNHITTDMAVIPLLLVLPLMAYLLSFVIVFAKVGEKLNYASLSILALVIIMVLSAMAFTLQINSYGLILSLDLALLLLVALLSHGKLAEEKPHPAYLTNFYLYMSLGGVLGGAAVALLAPVIFNGIYEYALLMFAATLVFPTFKNQQHHKTIGLIIIAAVAVVAYQYFFTIAFNNSTLPNLAVLLLALVAGLYFAGKRPLQNVVAGIFILGGLSASLLTDSVILQKRSFFGVHKIVYSEPHNSMVMVHGNTNHGYQSLDDDKRLNLISYYNTDYSFGDIKRGIEEKRQTLPDGEGLHLGITGLGGGNLTCLGEKGDHVTYFEIDPLVLELASNTDYFTYLRDCPASNNVVLGDARLTMRDHTPNSLDFLQLDAFSSDAIPLHLITKEATELYFNTLKDDGFLVFHISNRHLDLTPVLYALSEELGLDAYKHVYDKTKYTFGPKTLMEHNELVAMARPGQLPESIAGNPLWKPLSEVYEGKPMVRVWTDDYANVLAAYR